MRTSLVCQLSDPGDREDGSRGPQHVRHGNQPGPRDDGSVQGRERPFIVRAVGDVRETNFHVETVAERVQRPDRSSVFLPGSNRHVPRSPIERPRCQVHAVGGRMREGDRPQRRPEHGRDPGPGLVHPIQQLEVVVELTAPDRSLVLGELCHQGGDLGRHRARGSRIQLDAGRQ